MPAGDHHMFLRCVPHREQRKYVECGDLFGIDAFILPYTAIYVS